MQYYRHANPDGKAELRFWAISKQRFSKTRQISENYAFLLVKCIRQQYV